MVKRLLKRRWLALGIAAAVGLLDFGGASRVGEVMGIAELRAQTEVECSNTSCNGPDTCTYRGSEQCFLKRGSCTVTSC